MTLSRPSAFARLCAAAVAGAIAQLAPLAADAALTVLAEKPLQ